MRAFRFAAAIGIVILVTAPLHAFEGLDSKGSTKDEPFRNEQWPEARTLVWANPGTSGSMQTPKNWTEYASTADYLAEEEGRPATNPPDKKTDIILPDSPHGQSYVVACMERRNGDDDSPQRDCRHITIGKDAGLDGGCEFSRGGPAYPRAPGLVTPMGIYGNVTVNDGGYIYGPHVFLGDKHTYFAGRTDVDGILFDKVYPGGIIVAPEARAKWKNVYYGQNNLAAPEELFWDLKTEGPQEVGPRVRRSRAE